MHEFRPAQETPKNELPCFATKGVRRSFQALPFQVSTNGPASAALLGAADPTAMQNEAERQVTPFNPLRARPPAGVGSMLHLLPFQISTSARASP
jgi:hypothetical protein